MDANGDFVVTWTAYGEDASKSLGIYAQRYNSSGVLRDSSKSTLRAAATRRYLKSA